MRTYKYYYIYKVKCLCGSFKDKYYYGQHKTNKLNDGYIGSGTLLKCYFDKYGKIDGETYLREIIAYYNNEDELNKAEEEIVGNKYKDDDMCLNIRTGGSQFLLPDYKYEEIGDKLRGTHWGHHTDETKQLLSQMKMGENNPMYGKSNTPEAIEKIKKKLTGIKRSDEYKAKISKLQRGVPNPKEQNEAHSKFMKEYYKTHDAPNKGKHPSEETKNKMRESALKRDWPKHWKLNPETGKRIYYS